MRSPDSPGVGWTPCDSSQLLTVVSGGGGVIRRWQHRNWMLAIYPLLIIYKWWQHRNQHLSIHIRCHPEYMKTCPVGSLGHLRWESRRVQPLRTTIPITRDKSFFMKQGTMVSDCCPLLLWGWYGQAMVNSWSVNISQRKIKRNQLTIIDQPSVIIKYSQPFILTNHLPRCTITIYPYQPYQPFNHQTFIT